MDNQIQASGFRRNSKLSPGWPRSQRIVDWLIVHVYFTLTAFLIRVIRSIGRVKLSRDNFKDQPDLGDITMVLRPAEGPFWAPADRRLARLLKTLKRGYGFECRAIFPRKG